MPSNGLLPTRADLLRAGINIAVAVPLERTINSMTFDHFWSIAMRGWPLITMGYGRTDVQRNHFAAALLRSEYTHVCMLDLDHQHPANVVEHHAKWILDDPTKRVIAGLNFRRGAPFDPLAFRYGDDGQMYPVTTWAADSCIEVDALGHGSLMVHRSVFEQLTPPYWAYDYGQVPQHWPSEDMYFCYLCREVGIKLWIDTGVTSPHLIVGTVDEGVYRAWEAQHPEKARS